MDVETIFGDFFICYCSEKGKDTKLTYVVTSTHRKGGASNPHAMIGNAMDFTLRWRGDYAPIQEYNKLFAGLMLHWPFRAGIDNTYGNIHIHIDLGQVLPDGQKLPYFFKEEDSKWLKEIKTEDDL